MVVLDIFLIDNYLAVHDILSSWYWIEARVAVVLHHLILTRSKLGTVELPA